MEQARILIIDDDPDITEAMRIVLGTHNYTVAIASNSADAMEQLEQEKPELIILDVMMDSEREGFMLNRKLKQDPAYKDIPILMITAVKEKTGIDFKPVAGDESWLPVEEFLDKPVEPNILLEKVEWLLQKNK